MTAFRRWRSPGLEELAKDPFFPYYVGRLIGASEMTAHWLQMQIAPDEQDMGRRLGMVVNWFLREEPVTTTRHMIDPQEVQTQIITPDNIKYQDEVR